MSRLNLIDLKSNAVLLTLVLVLLAVAPVTMTAFAQQVQSGSFDQSVYYQGDNGQVTVVLLNNHNSFQICTKQFYIQFDWQASGTAFTSSDTSCMASGQTHTFVVSFSIPTSVSVGAHTYNIVWVDNGILLGTVTVSSGSLNVHDANEKVYNGLYATLQPQISSASFSCSAAKADLSQAQSYFDQGVTLANQGQFASAVNDLNQASSFLSQAGAVTCVLGIGTGGDVTWVILLVVIIILAGAFFLFRSRRSGVKATPAVPSPPTPASPSVSDLGHGICPNCGHVNKPGNMFCSDCGAKLPPA